MEKRPAFIKIMQQANGKGLADYFGLISVMLWGIYLFQDYINGHPLPHKHNPLYLCLVFTIITIGIYIWRYINFLNFYKKSSEVKAIIDNVDISNSEIKIDYSYSFQGQKYFKKKKFMKSKRSVIYKIGKKFMKSKQILNYNDGDELTVLIDPKNPNRTFIKDLKV